MPNGFSILSSKVAEMRRAALLTQSEFARRQGLSLGAIQRIEGGRKVTIRSKTIRSMAEVFGKTPQELLEQIKAE